MGESTSIHGQMLSETHAYQNRNYTPSPPYYAPSEVAGGLRNGVYGPNLIPILPQQFGVNRDDISWKLQQIPISLGAPTEGSTIDASTINTPADFRSDPGSEYNFEIPYFSFSSDDSYNMGIQNSHYIDNNNTFQFHRNRLSKNSHISQQNQMVYTNSMSVPQSTTFPVYEDGLHGTGTWASADPAHEQFSDPKGAMIHHASTFIGSSPFDWPADQALAQAPQFPTEASLLTQAVQDDALSHHTGGLYNDDLSNERSLINPDAYVNLQSPKESEKRLFDDFSVQQFGCSDLPQLNIPSTPNGKQLLSPTSQFSATLSECSSYGGYINSQQNTPQSSRNHSPLSEHSSLPNNGPHPTSARSIGAKSSKGLPWICTCTTVVSSGRPRDIDRHRSRCKTNPNEKQLKCPVCEHAFQFGRNDRMKKHIEKEHPEYFLNTRPRCS